MRRSQIVVDQIMVDAIKKPKASELARTFVCHLLNLSNCVKQQPKTCKIAHFESIHQHMALSVVTKQVRE